MFASLHETAIGSIVRSMHMCTEQMGNCCP